MGQKGDEGHQGVKGDKDEPGTSYTAPSMSAFSARKTSSHQISSGTEVVIFEAEDLDVGNDFNPSTGVFTCRIQGLYYFAFTFLPYSSYDFYAFLEHNGTRKVKIFTNGLSSHYAMQSQSVILSLQIGDEIKLTADASSYIYNSGDLTNTFNGYLIHAT